MTMGPWLVDPTSKPLPKAQLKNQHHCRSDSYRVVNEQTVERVREDTLETVYGELQSITYRDQIQGGTHLALVKGQPSPDQPVLTRVHVPDPVRDLLEAKPSTVNNWSLSASMKAVQEDDGPGVIVVLETWENS